MKSQEVYLVLHDIRSAQNVGSLFRTADAAGIRKIFLTGYTPAPLDKFERPNKEIAKTALGAEKTVLWEKLSFENCVKKFHPVKSRGRESAKGGLFNRVKKEKVQIIAIEQDKSSTDYRKVKAKYPVAFVLGNEVTGLEKKVLKMCDIIAEVPMRGEKESLNVSVVGGIALFRILDL